MKFDLCIYNREQIKDQVSKSLYYVDIPQLIYLRIEEWWRQVSYNKDIIRPIFFWDCVLDDKYICAKIYEIRYYK